MLVCSATLLAADTLRLKDGSTVAAALKSCDAEQCSAGARRISLSDIQRIELTEGPEIPASARAVSVVLTDGTVLPGAFVGLSLGFVWIGDEEIDRSRVAAVILADPSPSGALRGTPDLPQSDTLPPPSVTPPPITPSASLPLTPPAAPTAPSVRPSRLAASLLLNEVSFLPSREQAPFVEVLNATDEPLVLADFALHNARREKVALPATSLSPGALLRVDLSQQFLGGESGSLWLRSKDRVLDAVAWGLPQPFSVNLCRGGRCTSPSPGSVIARIPGETAVADAGAWAPLDAAHATPGVANPRPPVSAIAGIDGMMYPAKASLSWYGVPGAVKYRVQVARDAAFATAIEDATIDAQQRRGVVQEYFEMAALPSGAYFWRVQAIGPGGETAAFSRAVAFSVGLQALPAMTSSAAAVVRRELDVPVFQQVKDTRMLLLEPWSETDPAWDTPNRSGYPYCVRAAVSMLNAFHGGKLSQDRIGFEAFKDLRSGPEYDLPIVGISDDRTNRYVLPLALGTRGTYRLNPHRAAGYDVSACLEWQQNNSGDCPRDVAYAWGAEVIRSIRSEIDAGRPLLATDPGHMFLVVGYIDDGADFFFIYQDGAGRLTVPANDRGFVRFMDSYWTGLTPASAGRDEPTLTSDADGDGVVDFDETRRFNTNPAEKDTDQDGVEDKKEIRSSVFDPEDGYLREVIRLEAGTNDAFISLIASGTDLVGRDTDRDGKMMELDPDSDDGGCKDGEEDADGNGRREAGETSNFKRPDDPRRGGDGGCGVWYGKVLGRAIIDDSIWDFTTDVRLKEEWRGPIRGAGGRDRIGTAVKLQCAGTTFQVRLSGACTAQSSGAYESNEPATGLIYTKTADVNMTPFVGVDPPIDASWYMWGCGMLSEPVTVTCPPYGSMVLELPLASWGIGMLPNMPPWPGDVEPRFLQDGRMTGSYRRTYLAMDLAVSWNVCPAGTPCAEPPPLP